MRNRDPFRMIRLSAAASVVEQITGERPHVATMHRWASRGLRGVKLRCAYAGGHRRTTEQWVKEFFEGVTRARTGEDVDLSDDRSLSERRQQTQSVLERAGISTSA